MTLTELNDICEAITSYEIYTPRRMLNLSKKNTETVLSIMTLLESAELSYFETISVLEFCERLAAHASKV